MASVPPNTSHNPIGYIRDQIMYASVNDEERIKNNPRLSKIEKLNHYLIVAANWMCSFSSTYCKKREAFENRNVEILDTTASERSPSRSRSSAQKTNKAAPGAMRNLPGGGPQSRPSPGSAASSSSSAASSSSSRAAATARGRSAAARQGTWKSRSSAAASSSRSSSNTAQSAPARGRPADAKLLTSPEEIHEEFRLRILRHENFTLLGLSTQQNINTLINSTIEEIKKIQYPSPPHEALAFYEILIKKMANEDAKNLDFLEDIKSIIREINKMLPNAWPGQPRPAAAQPAPAPQPSRSAPAFQPAPQPQPAPAQSRPAAQTPPILQPTLASPQFLGNASDTSLPVLQNPFPKGSIGYDIHEEFWKRISNHPDVKKSPLSGQAWALKATQVVLNKMYQKTINKNYDSFNDHISDFVQILEVDKKNPSENQKIAIDLGKLQKIAREIEAEIKKDINKRFPQR